MNFTNQKNGKQIAGACIRPDQDETEGESIMTEAKTYRYFLQNDKDWGEGWSLIVLDQSGTACTMFVTGDFGNYVARFHFRDDFRQAVLRLGKAYLLSKIAEKTVYDGEATARKIKQYILESRRDGFMSREKAREEWDRISEHDAQYFEQAFNDWLRETEIDWEIASDFSSYEYPAGAKAFVERTMPRLKEILRSELEDEEKVAAS